MPTEPPVLASALEVRRSLERLAEDNPALCELIAAFGPLLSAQAGLVAGLPALEQPVPLADPARLAQGEPLAEVEDFLLCQGLDLAEYLRTAGRGLLPALGQGLPGLARELKALQEALGERNLAARDLLSALLAGRLPPLQTLAEETGLAPETLAFVLLQMARPLLIKRARALAGQLNGAFWERGACPVCGSLPELSILQGRGGERWLRCSLCGHHWRFSRTSCPVCGNEDQDHLEHLFVQGRERERAECCLACGKYLVCLDVRERDRLPVWETAALGLSHLDLLAQDKGLSPAAFCAWNQFR